MWASGGLLLGVYAVTSRDAWLELGCAVWSVLWLLPSAQLRQVERWGGGTYPAGAGEKPRKHEQSSRCGPLEMLEAAP